MSEKRRLSRLTDEVPHEPTTGEEVSAALVPVVQNFQQSVAEINKSNTALTQALVDAIKEALVSDSKTITVQQPQWSKLTFDVVRNSKGDMAKIVVTRD